jgi:hypothetical protein
MFNFISEPEIPMLTVRRNGEWSVATVAAYEIVLRQELVLLHQSGKPRGMIVDIGGTWPQQRSVAWALRRIEARLGDLRPERIAVVSSFGASRLHARHLKQPDTQVFTSMKFAREWIIRRSEATGLPTVVFDQPIQADPEGPTVHIYGPTDNGVMLTPGAALETAKRIGDAAVEVIIGIAMSEGEKTTIESLTLCADASLANSRLQAQGHGVSGFAA